MTLKIGDNIKALRAEKGVTQEQLADHLAITYQSVSKWENGVTSPDLQLIPQIAEYFDVTIDQLFTQSMSGYKNKAQRLVAIYEQSGKKEDYERADKECEKLFAEGEPDGADMRMYGILNEYHSYALAKKAEELYKQAIAAGNKSESQLMMLLSKTSRNDENIATWQEALKDDPANVRNWQLLASAYEYANMQEKALEIVEEGLTKFPNDAWLLCQCGNLYRTLKRYDEAIELHEKAITVAPTEGGSYYSLAFIYQDLGKHNEAIAAWERVVESCLKHGFHIETRWPLKEIARLKKLAE